MSNYLYWAIGLLLLLILAWAVAKKRSSKIDHMPPEHRAKENELYEAFGLEEPHEEEPPKGHDKKQEEVEKVFDSMNVEVEANQAPPDTNSSQDPVEDKL